MPYPIFQIINTSNFRIVYVCDFFMYNYCKKNLYQEKLDETDLEVINYQDVDNNSHSSSQYEIIEPFNSSESDDSSFSLCSKNNKKKFPKISSNEKKQQ